MSDRFPPAGLPGLIVQLLPSLREAGAAILQHRRDGTEAEEGKTDGSPVTAADRDSDAILTKALSALTPDIPIVSEEGVDAGRIPSPEPSLFWLVDPLDGTKEFISGNEDFCVLVALVEDGHPIFGAVYVPATGMAYFGHGIGTALRIDRQGQETRLAVREAPAAGISVVTSRSHRNDDALDSYLADLRVADRVPRGSALKLCLLAEGRADLYPRLGPTSGWDIAAAHAVLSAAGGQVRRLDDHQSLQYSADKDRLLNPHFVAIGDAGLLEQLPPPSAPPNKASVAAPKPQ